MPLKPLADMLELNPSPDGLIVLSTMDIELLAITNRGSKKNVRRLAEQVPQPSELTRIFQTGGIDAVKSAIDDAATIPSSSWWCDNSTAADAVLEGIYKRLKLSPHPYDAYDFGLISSIPWVQLWLD